jgi:hypothetical protein
MGTGINDWNPAADGHFNAIVSVFVHDALILCSNITSHSLRILVNAMMRSCVNWSKISEIAWVWKIWINWAWSGSSADIRA